MADRDDLADSFLTLVDETFRRLTDEPDAHLHVAGFAEGDVAFVLTRDGLEVRRRAEVHGGENLGVGQTGEPHPGLRRGDFRLWRRTGDAGHGRSEGVRKELVPVGRIGLAVGAVLVLVAVGCSDDNGGDSAGQSAVSTSVEDQATTTTLPPLPTLTTVPWVQPEGCADPEGTAPPAVCPDPAVVPAVVGPVDIVVEGYGFSFDALGAGGGYESVHVHSCPGADLPAPTPVPGGPNAPSETIEEECGINIRQQRDEGSLASGIPLSDGYFTTPLTVMIDQSVIDAGRLAIVAGDIFVPKGGVGVLQVGDESG